MDDLSLKQEKYRCEVSDNSADLEIADLFIKLSNGTIKRPVRLSKGMYVPTELLDFDDVKKSRLNGSLKKCIDNKWIVVENPAFIEVVTCSEENVRLPIETSTITETKAGIIKSENVTGKISEITQARKGVSPFPEEKIDVSSKENVFIKESRSPNLFAITENQIKETEFSKFMSLKYFQKLKMIKETTSVSLLNEIILKSEYPQLIHNASMRLQELK